MHHNLKLCNRRQVKFPSYWQH